MYSNRNDFNGVARRAMDAELTKQLGTLETAEWSIILDFMQSTHLDAQEKVNGRLTTFRDLVSVRETEIKNN